MKIFKKKFLMFFSLLLILNLGFCNLLVAENSSDNVKKLTYIGNIFYDENGKPANWWYDSGTARFFFKDGKKHTGIAKDENGKIYFERKYKVSNFAV